MKIAITGASGFIGQHVVRAALTAGHNVVALARSQTRFLKEVADNPSAIEYRICDLLQNNSLPSAIEGCDCVIHLAANMNHSAPNQAADTLTGTRNLLNALEKANIPHLIGVSSISVLDYLALRPMSTIDESVPLQISDAALGPYAQMKRDQEKLLTEWQHRSQKRLTIIRPGLVYDDTNLPNAHAGFIKGNKGITATHNGEVPLVHVKHVANALILAATSTTNHPQPEIYHLTDNHLPTQSDYLEKLQQQNPFKSIALSWENYTTLASTLQTLTKLIGKQNKLPDSFRQNSVAARQKPFKFSNEKARKELGWEAENE